MQHCLAGSINCETGAGSDDVVAVLLSCLQQGIRQRRVGTGVGIETQCPRRLSKLEPLLERVLLADPARLPLFATNHADAWIQRSKLGDD